jgi:hypothetical protein
MSWIPLSDFYNIRNRLDAKDRYEDRFSYPASPYIHSEMIIGLIRRDEEIARLANKITELQDKIRVIENGQFKK